MMTLTGYRFMATGVTEYAFYNGSDRLLRVAHTALLPVRIFYSRWYTITVPEHLYPGMELPFLDETGMETVSLLLLNDGRFAVYSATLTHTGGSALTGRIITNHKRSILYTVLDDEEAIRVEYSFNRSDQRNGYGEWAPQRYVATLNGTVDLVSAIALAVPFLEIPGIEVK